MPNFAISVLSAEAIWPAIIPCEASYETVSPKADSIVNGPDIFERIFGIFSMSPVSKLESTVLDLAKLVIEAT